MGRYSIVRSISASSKKLRSLRSFPESVARSIALDIGFGLRQFQVGSQSMPKRPTTSSSRSSRATPKTTRARSGTLTARLPKQLASLRRQDISRQEFISKLDDWLEKSFGARPVVPFYFNGRVWTKSYRCRYDQRTKEVAILTISFTCLPYSAGVFQDSR